MSALTQALTEEIKSVAETVQREVLERLRKRQPVAIWVKTFTA